MEYELYHHGIKGMRWGVRRYQNSDGSLTDAGARRQAKIRNDNLAKARAAKAAKKAEAEKRAVAISKGKISAKKMTEAELRERKARLELEKEYNKLLSETGRAKAKKGKDFALRILEKSSENILTQTTTYMMGEAVNYVTKNLLGVTNATKTVVKEVDGKKVEETIKIFQDIVNPRKGQKDK